MAARLVDLERRLGRVEDDGHPPLGTWRRRQECHRFLGDPLSVPREVERLDGLPAGTDLMASEAVRKAPRLHLVVAGGGRIEATTGFDDRLVEHRPIAACEVPHLAN